MIAKKTKAKTRDFGKLGTRVAVRFDNGWQLGRVIEYRAHNRFLFVLHFANNEPGKGERVNLELEKYGTTLNILPELEWVMLKEEKVEREEKNEDKEQKEEELETEEQREKQRLIEEKDSRFLEKLREYCVAGNIDLPVLPEPVTPRKGSGDHEQCVFYTL